MRPEKQLLLDEIKHKLDRSTALVLTRYQKMTPNLSSSFRIQLGQSGSDFEVVKKRILLKAAQNAGVSLDADMLQGHIGIVFTAQDPVQMTKSIFQFAKEHEETLEVIGGRFEGQVCTAKDIKIISELPTKDEMRAQLLGLFEAPMANTLSVIEALLSSVMHCLENKSQQNN